MNGEETTSASSFGVWRKEKEFLEKEKATNPDLFLRAPIVDDDAVLKAIGIENIFGERPSGHIKLFPEDFIVEEVSKDGVLHTIEDEPVIKDAGGFPEEIRTVWADVVKMGVDTIEVINELSRRIGVDKKFIGAAGIKDKYALTSQSISFRGVRPETLSSVTSSNFFLKNITAGKGALQIGDLSGNRFTIFVRTKEPVDEKELEEKLRDLEEQGSWNFFYLQRFGAPRFISHKLGLLILQGKFEDAAKSALTHFSEREAPYFKNFRNRLSEFWGKWDEILTALDSVPYTFRNEKKVVQYLKNNPADFIGALNQVPEQVKLWVYAYGSYLFNKKLSGLIQSGEDVPFTLPLALSGGLRAGEFYGEFFRAHRIAPPFPALKNFPYVQKQEKDIETLKKITLHGVRAVKEGVAIDFFLEKASYATTFLSHLFTLSSGQPLPEGISIKEVDSKLILGTGMTEPLRRGKFKELFEMRKEMDIFKKSGDELV